MRLLYTLIIRFFTCIMKGTSPFSLKAKLWYNGRKDVFPILEKKCAGKKNTVWFHCASLGEFEQGKPLMEKIKQQEKDVTVLVTFFSPSGFEVKKDDPVADIITYLPADTPKNAKEFIHLVKPQKVFFVKYEYWYNYIDELHRMKIPFYYISANFRKNQYFFKNYGNWFLKQLKKCSFFFVQNEESKTILEQHGISKVAVVGDTRFDRVYAIAQQNYSLDFITTFKAEKKLLVAGSTWVTDEKLLSELLPRIIKNYKLVVAPHVVEHHHIEKIKQLFQPYAVVCFSEKESSLLSHYDVLIIDTIGLLSKIYKYADISYIGGAFKTGLHNILEAAVFAKPFFFGPHYQKFNEAVELVAKGAAFPVSDATQMANEIQQFENNSSYYHHVCEICKKYIIENIGATERIISKL